MPELVIRLPLTDAINTASQAAPIIERGVGYIEKGWGDKDLRKFAPMAGVLTDSSGEPVGTWEVEA